MGLDVTTTDGCVGLPAGDKPDNTEQEETELAKRATKTQGKRSSSSRQSVGEAFMKSMARSLGSAAGRKLFRGVLGSLLK